MKDPAPSLRLRLTLAVVGIVGVAVILCALVVHAAFTRTVWHQFDVRLAQDAHAVSLLVEETEKGPWELESGSAEVCARRGLAAFEIRLDDGAVLVREPLRASDLPHLRGSAEPALGDWTMPDGRRVRLYRAWLPPRLAEGLSPVKRSGRLLEVMVARDLEPLSATIATFSVLLWAPAAGVIVLTALVVSLAIRSMLGHVTRLSEGIAQLDAASLGRLWLGGIPAELRPPFIRLNELLERIQDSLARERQFNADVSHELRTPLSGLQSILEVSLSRARTADQYRGALGESLAVVRQMETAVKNLLILAHLGSGQASFHRENVPLRDLADSCFAPFAEKARARALNFENRVPPGLRVSSDGEKLRLVTANLLSNAAEYTAEGGWVVVESDPDRSVVICVRDSGPPIPPGAEPKLFDPFFRLDGARSGGGEHCGIGLAVVRGVCGVLGYRVEARNEPGGAVAFVVSSDRREPVAGND